VSQNAPFCVPDRRHGQNEASAPQFRHEVRIVTAPREAIPVRDQQLQCYERLSGQETAPPTPLASVVCVPFPSGGEMSASLV